MSDRPFGILFVCTANICRSPMAEHLLRGSLAALLDTGGAIRFDVSSAGILGWDGEPMDPAAAAELRRLGGDPSRFTQWRRVYADGMCRNIRTLYNFEPPATSDEVRAAATQYVRKIAGTTKPSVANQQVFDEAIEAVVAATSRLLDGLVTGAAPRDREVEAAKARARNALRFGSAPRRASAF